jgi:ferredoxin
VKLNNESENTKEPDSSSPGVEDVAATPSVPDAAGVVAIDFHSAEFNHTDDLNDYSGNYRSFQPLDGIITADMRHQMERRLSGSAADPCAGDAAPLKKQKSENIPTEDGKETGPITVISAGRTLIIDTDFDRAIACGRLLSDQGLTCSLLVLNRGPHPDTSAANRGQLTLLEGDAVSVTGGFGGFVASLAVDDLEQRRVKEAGDRTATFDLVLDLQLVSAFAGAHPPLGYYAPGPDSKALEEAMLELPEMRGRFQKPQFMSFLEKRCLHGRSRTHDCRRCLEVCPIGAIQSVNRKITVNHYICEGCGGCALVCPADAIRRVHPSPEALLNAIRSRLETRTATDIPATLVISDSPTFPSEGILNADKRDQAPSIHFEVEQIGHAGLELILEAFVHGAGKVVVACGPQNPPGIQKAVAEQTRMAGALLEGIGLGKGKIRFVVDPPAGTTSGIDAFQEPCSAVEPYAPGHDTRKHIRLAIRDLCARASASPSWSPLPSGSPFGVVAVDPAVCTLCMACVVACPSGALSAGGEAPRLQFLEARCHQCGLCGEICPEGAIRLLPGIHVDLDAAEVGVVLGEAEPFRCIECGLPFASRAMIDRMQAKLKGHWMYAGERQLRRLRLCGNCRAADALTSGDMKAWNRS